MTTTTRSLQGITEALASLAAKREPERVRAALNDVARAAEAQLVQSAVDREGAVPRGEK